MLSRIRLYLRNIRHFDENTNFFKWNMKGYELIGLSLWNNSVKYKIYQCFCILALFNNMFFTLWNLLNNIIEGNTEKVLENLTLSVAVSAVLLRYMALVINRKTYFEVMDFINGRVFQKKNTTFAELRKQNYNSNLRSITPFICLGLFTSFAFNLAPLVEGKRKFVMMLYYPWIDFQTNDVAYYTVYCISAFSAFISGSLVIISCTFISTLLQFLSHEIHLLGMCYEEVFGGLTKEQSLDRIHEELKKNVVQHELLMKHAQKMKDALYLPMLFQVTGSCLIMAFSGYRFIKADELSVGFLARVQHLIFKSLELFFYCHCGENLKNENYKIIDMIYESKWYNLKYSQKMGKKYKKVHFMLMMNLMRATKVVRISAGGMAFLTYESYMAIVKTSYSLLALLINYRV